MQGAGFKLDNLFKIIIISFGLSFQTGIAAASYQKPSATNTAKMTKETDPPRRALPAAFDSVFPSTEYLGPTLGVPNTDPVFPMTKELWKTFPQLEKNDIRIYGWLNPSYNASSSQNSNIPLSYTIVPNQVELEQLIVRLERQPNTVQMDHIDWGFRVSNLYGIDYRYTIAQGIISNQLLQNNQLYGYDPVEMFIQLYLPTIAQGMVLTIGRYISPPDIEAQLSPQNYLLTHSLMFTFDAYTMTGVNAAVKFNDQWSILLGLNAGDDVAFWNGAAHIPTGQGLVRWVSKSNNNSLWGGITSVNNGFFKDNHDNLQEFNLTWSHRFTPEFFTLTEAYYLYQYDAVLGGTCNFGPVKRFGGGGGCGAPIPGKSPVWGAVNYTMHKLTDKRFLTFRSDWLYDVKGERSGFATQYYSFTLGITQQFNELVEFRPEVRYESAFGSQATPYDNGTQRHQTTFGIDMIGRF